jgi:ribose 5-phosphate isomerase
MSWVVIIKNRINGRVRKIPLPIEIDESDVRKIAKNDCSEYEYILNVRESEENEIFVEMESLKNDN